MQRKNQSRPDPNQTRILLPEIKRQRNANARALAVIFTMGTLIPFIPPAESAFAAVREIIQTSDFDIQKNRITASDAEKPITTPSNAAKISETEEEKEPIKLPDGFFLDTDKGGPCYRKDNEVVTND